MIDSYYSLLSALLGLVLLNAFVFAAAHSSFTNRGRSIPIEVRYTAAHMLFFLIILNGNQWVPGDVIFPLLVVAILCVVLFSCAKPSRSDRNEAFREGISLFVVQVMTLLGIFLIFQMQRYWLLESHNHDSMVYYQGIHWAFESKLFVASEAVRARWGLGICGDGANWIGFDCPLYRGGTYTIAAWAQYFSPRVTGSGLYFVGAYAATIAWTAVRLLTTSVSGWSGAYIRAIFAIFITISTGLVGAIINSNLATAMGSASLLIVFALALRSDLHPTVRYVLMAAWCAVCAHLYAEAVFYAGLFVCLVFTLELPKQLRTFGLKRTLRLAAILLGVVAALGNIPLTQAFSSIFILGKIAKGGEWFSWYLHQNPLFWSGGFFAGLLMGVPPSRSIVILSSAISLIAAFFLLHVREMRTATLAFIGVSVLAVLYVELTGYQYGEHKIIHLLGPGWTFLVAGAIFQSLFSKTSADVRWTEKPVIRVVSLTGVFISSIVAFIFLSRSASLLDQLRGPHGIDAGLGSLSSYIRPGETVLLDDSRWIGVEKFHKSHYLTFQLHNQGAKVVMPNIDSDTLRGGYFRKHLDDKLRNSRGVEWLVQGRGHAIKQPVFLSSNETPSWENADFSLFRVDNSPLAVAGNGWYNCESGHCWTRSSFEIETFVPSTDRVELSLEFWAFEAPRDGTIMVLTSDGQLLATTSVIDGQLKFLLPGGWSRLIFRGDWKTASPKELKISEDSRELFLAVKKVSIDPQKVEKGD